MNCNEELCQGNLEDICIPDSGATHTILKEKKYFSELRPTQATINAISGPADLIEGTRKAHFMLPNGTRFLINNALFSPKSKRNLLSFNDIHHNGYDTQTVTIDDKKFMHIIYKNHVLERLPTLGSGLHYTYISMIESHMVLKEKSCDLGILSLWHDRLGHPGTTMMRRIIEGTNGHPLKD
jgi:hypothetical protein